MPAAQLASPPVEARQEAIPAAHVSAAQLFMLADAARDRGDFLFAERAYRALSSSLDGELRAEARFRLAIMLADCLHKYREAAIELRHILDEKPDAAGVRLELARIQAQLGNLTAARRELSAAEAVGLPPDVARTVRFYSAALQARDPFGASFEADFAPDSNINRATRSDTIGTVAGNFTLNADGRARSGVGFVLKSHAYARAALGPSSNLLARLDTSATLYGAASYSDIMTGLQVGPEWRSGLDRVSISLGPAWRWYGTNPYSFALNCEASLIHPLGKRAQGNFSLGVSHTVNRINDMQSGVNAFASASLDRAMSARSGIGAGLSASRMQARDAGWSDVTLGAKAYAWRELGRTTAVVTLGYQRLEADGRLALFPARRIDNLLAANGAITWRALQWKGLAPVTRIRWERNRSTLDLYTYNRVAMELGLAAAF